MTTLATQAHLATLAAENALAALDGRWSLDGVTAVERALRQAILARLDWSGSMPLEDPACDLRPLVALAERQEAVRTGLWALVQTPAQPIGRTLFGVVSASLT